MDAAGGDPDIRPAVFYGVWPRFALAADAERRDEVDAPAEAETVPVV